MKKYLIILIVGLLCSSCKKDLDELEKYQPPDWLKGKLYSQVKDRDELSVFAEALKLTGMDTIINTSGLFTVFAPDNDAFSQFFKDHPEYDNDIRNIPEGELQELVDYHIVQNSWSKEQLSSLNIDGWIDEDEKNVTQRAYKKETLFRKNNKSYSVNTVDDHFVINPEGQGVEKIVYSGSRKYVPVFFQQYFDTYRILHSDYEFYFNRPYEGGYYYAGAKVTNDQEIPAENGYVYIIDRVVQPLNTAEEILENGSQEGSYKEFLDLIHEFPEFSPNLDATFRQTVSDVGQAVDTLYNLNYPELAFNIHSEITDPTHTRAIASIQYHNALFAPTDAAFGQFIERYLEGSGKWGNLKDLPRSIKSIIVNSYMVPQIIYESDMQEGFLNAENDLVSISAENIIDKKFGSNATFVGLDQAIVPRAFSSVSAPVYLRRGFYTILNAIEETNILAALKKKDQNYSFFIIPDLSMGTLADSSLIIGYTRNRLTFEGYNRSLEDMEKITINDLRKKLLNHVGTSLPEGQARVEFVENLAGNFIVFDNENNTVSGTTPSTYGLNGDSLVNIIPEELEEKTDNGRTYKIQTWFSFANSDVASRIQSQSPSFMQLMVKAGLAQRLIGEEYKVNFLSPGTKYTVLVPSSVALSAYNTDTLTNAELVQFIKNHFIPGKIIFTDGNVASGTFPTSNPSPDQSLTIETGFDIISVKDKTGNDYLSIMPETEETNLTATTKIGSDDSGSEWNFITTAVVHTVDKVLRSDIIY